METILNQCQICGDLFEDITDRRLCVVCEHDLLTYLDAKDLFTNAQTAILNNEVI